MSEANKNISKEEIKNTIIAAIDKSGFIKYLDLEIIELEDDHAVGRIPFGDKFSNPYGSVHGGCLYALADTMAGALASMCGDFCTTVEGSMNYFEPAINTEYVYCYATLIRRGKHLVNVKIEIKDDNGKLLDDGSFNYFRLK